MGNLKSNKNEVLYIYIYIYRNRNKLTNIENKFTVTKGGRERGKDKLGIRD